MRDWVTSTMLRWARRKAASAMTAAAKPSTALLNGSRATPGAMPEGLPRCPGGGLQSCKATSVPHTRPVHWTYNSLINTGLRSFEQPSQCSSRRGQCKTRPRVRRALFSCATLVTLCSAPIQAQQRDADAAWTQGRHEAARAGYLRVLAENPNDVRANLRIGVLLSWQGKLDSSLVFLHRARTGDL